MNNLDIARWYFAELWSRGRTGQVARFIARQCAVRDPLFGDYIGAAGLEHRVRETRRAFPGLAWQIDEVLADAGDQLALTWTARAPAIEVAGLVLLRFQREQLVAITMRWEPRALVQQYVAYQQARALQPPPHARFDESDLDARWDL